MAHISTTAEFILVQKYFGFNITTFLNVLELQAYVNALVKT